MADEKPKEKMMEQVSDLRLETQEEKDFREKHGNPEDKVASGSYERLMSFIGAPADVTATAADGPAPLPPGPADPGASNIDYTYHDDYEPQPLD
jgi:hypothetical protein